MQRHFTNKSKSFSLKTTQQPIKLCLWIQSEKAKIWYQLQLKSPFRSKLSKVRFLGHSIRRIQISSETFQRWWLDMMSIIKRNSLQVWRLMLHLKRITANIGHIQSSRKRFRNSELNLNQRQMVHSKISRPKTIFTQSKS